MGVTLYDEAVLDKISGWVKDPNVRVLGTDDTENLFRMTANQTNDKPITLPLITITRNNSIDIGMTAKVPLSFHGARVKVGKKETLLLNAIPITIKYDIDVYARTDKEALAYCRELIFRLNDYPSFSITIPYNDLQMKHVGNITLLTPFTNNSSVSQRLIQDQFYRYTIPIEIDDAYLFSVPKAMNWEAEVEFVDARQGEN